MRALLGAYKCPGSTGVRLGTMTSGTAYADTTGAGGIVSAAIRGPIVARARRVPPIECLWRLIAGTDYYPFIIRTKVLQVVRVLLCLSLSLGCEHDHSGFVVQVV